MKKLGLFGVLGIVAIIVIAIVSAGKMGKTNPAFVRGKVVLSDALLEDAQKNKTLYISVRDMSQPMPPYGALRKTLRGQVGKTVYQFALTYDNLQRMNEGKNWPEKFSVKARLDRDGMGGMDQAGDLVGVVENLERGSKGVVINIDRKVE